MTATAADDRVAAAFAARNGPAAGLAGQAGDLVAAALAMAGRFHAGGTLVVFGTGGASTDAQHVAVEFMHPVIVGKRALPAISLTSDVATLTGLAGRGGPDGVFGYQIGLLAEPGDIALGIATGDDGQAVAGGLRAARERGLLTVALVGGDGSAIAGSGAADYVLTAASADPRVVKEVQVTAYHVLWELVHVFLEQPAVLGPGAVR